MSARGQQVYQWGWFPLYRVGRQALAVMSVMAVMALTGCQVEEEVSLHPIVPDYISQLGSVSEVFRDNYLLEDDDVRASQELAVMKQQSRRTVPSGIMRDAVSLRAVWTQFRPESAVSGWFLERGFRCEALTPQEQALKRDMLPHVYRKNNVLIHIFERQVATMSSDYNRLFSRGDFPVRIAVVRYDNVKQKFYPCHGSEHTIAQTYPIEKLVI